MPGLCFFKVVPDPDQHPGAAINLLKNVWYRLEPGAAYKITILRFKQAAGRGEDVDATFERIVE
jgi:hypothetical protein